MNTIIDIITAVLRLVFFVLAIFTGIFFIIFLLPVLIILMLIYGHKLKTGKKSYGFVDFSRKPESKSEKSNSNNIDSQSIDVDCKVIDEENSK